MDKLGYEYFGSVKQGVKICPVLICFSIAERQKAFVLSCGTRIRVVQD